MRSDTASLRESVRAANVALAQQGLAPFTWGNASAADRDTGIFAIKPSGVPYEDLRTDDIVTVNIETGETLEAARSPSVDTPTHQRIYKDFPQVGGVAHTHSHYATVWAQACRAIPCLGTTHADTFAGPVPVTRFLTPAEVDKDYEGETGRIITTHFQAEGINPIHVPGVLVAGHAPFTWGATVEEAVKHAGILEEVARMALHTFMLNPAAESLPAYFSDKHFSRKHGAGAYYGQR